MLQTLKQLLERNAQEHAEAVAFRTRRGDGYENFTFRRTAELAAALQAELIRRGVARGDRVALVSENRPEWPIAFLAITGLGAAAVPLDAALAKDELLPLIADSGAKIIVLSRRLAELAGGKPWQERRIFMEEFAGLPAAAPLPVAGPQPDDLASIVYTSGTTGGAKGVMLTHRNLMSNALAGAACFEIGPADNFLSVLPLHHTFETTGGFLAPFSKACSVTYAESLKPYQLLKNMEETGVTIMLGVPLLYQLFFDGIMRSAEEQGKGAVFSLLFRLSRLLKKLTGLNAGKLLFGAVHKKFGGRVRFFVTGGAPIELDLLKNFEALGFTMIQGYGLTESSPVLAACTPHANRLGSVGRPLPGVEIRIAGPDPVGEIVAAGPNIMKGYYKRDDLTDKVVIGGWLHTGDLGYFDADGYLYITGRSKDVIVTGSGVNVYPEEIEARLNKLPPVKESCVLGARITSGLRKGSEEVIAVIVPGEGRSDDEVKTAVAELNRRLTEYKRIARAIVRRADLPKTRIMKVKRFELRKELGI
ncbi:MAG: AMP-binding protein [Candidatus Saganbacteria bacterium]|nr:AMP-binding protein [Candidatus Saganbacteria bacterium]